MEKCYVCNETEQLVTYFPSNKTTLKKWKDILKITVDDNILNKKKICLKHFDKKFHDILLDKSAKRGRYIFPQNNDSDVPSSSENSNNKRLLEGESEPAPPNKKQINYEILLQIKNDKIVELTEKVKLLEKEKAALKSELAKANHLKTAVDRVTNASKSLTPSAKILVELLLLSNKNRTFTEPEKTFCKNIYHKNPSAYNHLRRVLGMGLPTSRTLIRWESSKEFNVGVIPEVMSHLKDIQINLTDHDKEVALIFDEMDGKKGLRYCESRDMIVGFEQLQERTPKMAKKFVAFMIRGISGKLGNVVVATFATENGLTGK